MRAILSISTLFLFLTLSINAQTQTQAYSFEEKHLSLGEVIKGETKSSTFRFQNTGEAALKIELVSSCECTSLEWTRKSIAIGEYGEIIITFDSNKKDVEELIDVDVYLKILDLEKEVELFEILTYDYRLID